VPLSANLCYTSGRAKGLTTAGGTSAASRSAQGVKNIPPAVAGREESVVNAISFGVCVSLFEASVTMNYHVKIAQQLYH
jgi:hypothetical protein